MLPGRTLFLLLWLWLALAVGAALFAPLLPLWQWGGVLLAGALLVDGILLWLSAPPEVERRVLSPLPLGNWSEVEVTVRNRGGSPLHLRLFDHYPQPAELAGMPAAARIAARGEARFGYRIRPLERGDFRFETPQLRLRSPAGLWWRELRRGPQQEVRVYPDFAAIARYTLLAHDQRLTDMGIRKRRRRGEGLEFHQLRDYREGDSLHQIDWKATSRTTRLIAREYQDERDQRIVFLLDAGRRMRARDGELSHFDHSLNAILLLAHVAQRQGDAVGLMSFGGPPRWLPPAKGPAAIDRLLDGLYDLQPDTSAPDYSGAALELMARQRKRALVILVTNLRDEDEQDLLPALQTLGRRHLVLLASLREKALFELLEEPLAGFDHALEKAAGYHYLEQRHATHRRLIRKGLFTLDVTPDRFPVALVNRYLEIKRGGML